MRQVMAVWLAHLAVFSIKVLPDVHSLRPLVFAVLAIAAQASLLTLPVLLLAALSALPANNDFSRNVARAARIGLPIVAIGMLILLYANYMIESMYGFYIDPFVWNLLTTPGGTAALGATNSFYFFIACVIGAVIAAYYIVIKTVPLESPVQRMGVRPAYAGIALVGIFSAQGTMYAVADYKSQVPLLEIGDHIAWYPRITARSFLQKLGIKPSRLIVDVGDGAVSDGINYPRTTPGMLGLEHDYNIVWLVAESWRQDMLDPEIMPGTWKFGEDNQRFDNHYSSGNGTRMGIFGQFYGLNGQFWFPALRYQRSPLLVDILQGNDYEIQAYTSASFSYPEFDKTVWLNIPETHLQSRGKGVSWERDRKNVTDLIRFTRTATGPFLAFMFFESTHANYDFPDENVIRSDYVGNFDYLATDIATNIEQIKNRYINASNHLDSQFQRVFAALAAQGRLDDTIVIVTGDHGEEFMENGRWGHNSTFSQQQVRVPLLIHIPGQPGRHYSGLTSHLDIPATVLAALGSKTNNAELSLGHDLLSPAYHREYAVISDWHGDALVTDKFKFSMSVKANARGLALTRTDDSRLEQQKLPDEVTGVLGHYLSATRQFRKPG
jgi:membrane-anchored protein YejM (alkaline phosphatase superfamily)